MSSQLVLGGLGGSSKNIAIYGYGDTNDQQVAVVPSSGSVFGGDVVTAYSTGLSVDAYSDRFLGTILDTAKWTNTSSGGTISVNNGLILTVPTSGGTASITSVSTYKNFDIDLALVSSYVVDGYVPVQSYESQKLTVYVDANNEVSISNAWDTISGRLVVIAAKVGGVNRLLYSGAPGSGSNFRITRLGGTVRAAAGSMEPVTLSGWTESAAIIKISSTAPAGLPVALQSTVHSFTTNILVSFGSIIADQVSVFGNGTLQIISPASADEGPVLLLAHTPSSTATLAEAWLYTADVRLSMGQDKKVYSFQDPVLRDI